MWEMLVVGGDVVHFYKLIVIWFLPQLNVWVLVMIPRSHTAAIGSCHFSVQCWRKRIMSSGVFTVAIFTGESSELVIFEIVSLIVPKLLKRGNRNINMHHHLVAVQLCRWSSPSALFWNYYWLSCCPEFEHFHTAKISINFNNGKRLIIYYMTSTGWLFRSQIPACNHVSLPSNSALTVIYHHNYVCHLNWI